MGRWYERVYRRGVIDMHITDHDPRFLSQVGPEEYAARLAEARVGSAVVYAHSHVGLCYFPTKTGKLHGGLQGRDLFGELVDRCHERGIAVVAYLSAIFDTHAYQANADWRIIDVNGNEASANSRYGICCPNAPYREYIATLAREVCAGYRVEGVRFDMTFWPRVCYCRHCRERFACETGADLPTVIDWQDPAWVAFQRKREEWLVDFARLLTSTVKSVNTALSVEHQASTYAAGWTLGVTHRLAEQCDFLQGDFYGDALQGSFVRKLFHNLSPNRPPGFETCISVDLANYLVLKPKELLRAKAAAAMGDACAFIFIDSIDPAGTLNPAVYERMGEVFAEVEPFEQHLGGELCQDVGVYLSTESKCDFADNGKHVDGPGLSGSLPHVEAALGACKALIEAHIPFGVITRTNLGDLTRHRLVILPNVLMMDEQEAEAFREYVRQGGGLYASAGTSLVTTDGRRQADFLLADVFGTSLAGETRERFTYIEPVPGHEDLLEGYTVSHPLGIPGPQLIVQMRKGAEVLGRLALPYTDPADPHRFASIHNNPPGVRTEHPAIVLNGFGEGRSIYVTTDLERLDAHRPAFLALLRSLCDRFTFEADAPKCVEFTLLHQPDRQRYLLSLVNFQRDLPNLPVHDIRVRVRLGKAIRRVVELPDERPCNWCHSADSVEVTVEPLETLRMYALEYG
ncbi:MAG: hypothetical protein FJX75_17370 [Armatimonadetes bacterium]|nr:hypothetical protein [Armatimonadota bacterium]